MKSWRIFFIYALLCTSCYDFSIPSSPDGSPSTIESGVSGSDAVLSGDNSAGMLQCENASVPADDPHNCGACGHDCSALPHVAGSVSCVDKTCVLTVASCAPGWADCVSNPEDGCETDITSAQNCGACGNDCSKTSASKCSPKSDASASQPVYECRSDCPAEAPTACDSSCVNTTTSVSHCGGCGIPCPESGGQQPTCTDAKCGSKCKIGFLECDGKCVPDDAKNCGKCGHACTNLPNVQGTVSCKNGVCSVPALSCAPGYAHCTSNPDDGCETKISEPENCGGCGKKCFDPTPNCSLKSGTTQAKPTYQCVTDCTADAPTKCGTKCVNTKTDTSNCGGCNEQCDKVDYGQPVCNNGQCSIKCNSGYHECDGACVSNTSPQSCGTQCDPCPTPTNATATCENSKCGFKCKNSGYLSCTDGCYPSDNKNCKTCGNDCTKSSKVCDTGSGVCVQCITKSNCKSSSAPYCYENECQECDPNGSNTCIQPSDSCQQAICDEGTCVTEKKNDGTSCGSGGSCKSGKCAVCGDGRKDPGEACDDGNKSNEDECLNNCAKASCTDGYVSPSEECDPRASGWSPSTCSTACKRIAYKYCGDGSACGTFNGASQECGGGGYCIMPCSEMNASNCPKIPKTVPECGGYCVLGCKNGECPNGMRCETGCKAFAL